MSDTTREESIASQRVMVDALLSGRDPQEKADFANLMSTVGLKLDVDLTDMYEVVRDQYAMEALDEYQAFLSTLPDEVRDALKVAQEAFKRAGVNVGLALVRCSNPDCHGDHDHGS